MGRIRGKKTQAGRHGPDSEYTIQKSICELLDWKAPWLLYCASAGGVRTSLVEARRMKLTGYKKGFPDLFFYEPRQGFNGLAIELKRDKQKKGHQECDPEQKRRTIWIWREQLHF